LRHDIRQETSTHEHVILSTSSKTSSPPSSPSSSSSTSSSIRIQDEEGERVIETGTVMEERKEETCQEYCMGWGRYHEMMDSRQTMCSGYTTIECAMLPEHNPRIAFFCWFENAVVEARGGQITVHAYCNKDRDVSLADLDPENIFNQPQGVEFIESGSPPDNIQPYRISNMYLANGDCNTGNPGHCMG
jgi:hypothetical protein